MFGQLLLFALLVPRLNRFFYVGLTSRLRGRFLSFLYLLKTTAILVFASDLQRSSRKQRNRSTFLKNDSDSFQGIKESLMMMIMVTHTHTLASRSLPASHQIPAILASWIQRFVFHLNFSVSRQFLGENRDCLRVLPISCFKRSACSSFPSSGEDLVEPNILA